MVLLGLTLGGLYAFEVVQSASGADRSMIFWALPVAMIGCLLVLMGAVLIWLARRAAGGDREVLSIVRILLVTIAVVAALILAGALLQQIS